MPAPGPGTEVVVGDGAGCCDAAAMLWVVGGGGTALGSRSQLSKDPKGKCCTTGNLDSTSALYILIMPYHSTSLVLEDSIVQDNLFKLCQPC